jgi:hypothetical protein
MKIFRSLIMALICLYIYSCEAPRLNPLDPQNPSYQLAKLEGVVSGPHNIKLAGVKVYWKNQNMVVQTDVNGNFSMDRLNLQNGMLYFTKVGYNNDSTFINWGGQKDYHVSEVMNSLPNLDSLVVYSVVQNYWPDGQNYSLTVQAAVSDQENDIDSVFVQCSPMNIYINLAYNPSSKFYEMTLSNISLDFLEQTIGRNFEIIVKDFNGRKLNIGYSAIRRIILDQVSFIFPANGNAAGSKPAFVWNRFKPGYNFTYMIEVYTNSANNPSEFIYSKDNISSDSISFTMANSLTTGSYYWVIWCVDEFKNRSRSKPATFVVQ